MKWNDAELHVAEVLGERQGSGTGGTARERDAHLHAGQRGAQAVVHAVAERQVTRRAAADVEYLRGVDEAGVAVARRQRHENESPAGIGHAGDLHLGGGDPRDGAVHDRQPAQQLLDGGPYRVGIVADRGELVGMPQ